MLAEAGSQIGLVFLLVERDVMLRFKVATIPLLLLTLLAGVECVQISLFYEIIAECPESE